MERIRPFIRQLSAERRHEVLAELEQASSPGFDYFLLVFLSCSIATFGLITNSIAVIIGAMLVAPLMSPILGLSLASLVGEQHMFRRAVVGLIEGVLLSIVLAFLWGTIAQVLPFDLLVEVPQEIMTRTRPTPFDLGIALAGGATAAYAMAQPRLSAALPGVAIATALMPPVCTVGIGLSLGDLDIAIGAGLLFLTNLAAISFAGIIVFAALGFRPAHPGQGTYLRESPGGAPITWLPEGTPIIILYQRQVFNQRVWIEIRDVLDQTGWVPLDCLILRP